MDSKDLKFREATFEGPNLDSSPAVLVLLEEKKNVSMAEAISRWWSAKKMVFDVALES